MINARVISINVRIDKRRAIQQARLIEWAYMLELLGEDGDMIKLVEGVMIVKERTPAGNATWRTYELINCKPVSTDIDREETIIDFIERAVGVDFYADIIEDMALNFEPSYACEAL